jgi:hypothetical protein
MKPETRKKFARLKDTVALANEVDNVSEKFVIVHIPTS